ncbi:MULTISPECIES: hypothetical protein [Bacillota]|uniref:hypothetical protein n=1 Tax=Bacillota TaxID=1239 RepID=UPI0039F123E2
MIYYFLVLILFVLSYLICTAIHEMGHWYFVKYTNNELIELRLGKGKKNEYLFKIGDLEIKKLFFFPGSRCLWKLKSWDNYKRDGILIGLGGCIANLITVIVTLPLGLTLMFLNLNWLAYFFLLMAFVSAFQFFFNLLPIKGHDGDKIIRYTTISKELLIKEHVEFDKQYKKEE